MPYLTPDSPPAGEFFCRVLRVPATPAFLSLVDGAITELCKAYNFEQFGTLTPDETAELFIRMWVDAMNEGNVCMPTTGLDVFYDQVAQNMPGGGILANTPIEVFFGTADTDNDGHVTVGSGFEFTVQPGRYLVQAQHILRAASAAIMAMWMREAVSGTIVRQGSHVNPPTNVQGPLHVAAIIHPTVTTVYEFMARSSVARATDAFGVPANIAGFPENYGAVSFLRVGDA